jgi:hypothetical protein
MEQLRLEVGLPGWLTNHSFETFQPVTTDSWMTRTWGFASRFKIEIRDSEAKLQPSRTNDRFLMEEFASAGFRGK